MLDPDARSLYSAALVPPEGYILDTALAATYSLDLTVLASFSLQLVLQSWGAHLSAQDPIALLEALRRVAGRLTVYCQAGRIQALAAAGPVFALLEPVVREVAAPRGGAFHPKLWVLRFAGAAGEPPLLRLLVLSRNLTADRSWDLSLVLEGTPGAEVIVGQEALASLVRSLPGWARVPDPARDAEAGRVAREVLRTRWTLPAGFERVSFHVLGMDAATWTPEGSDRLGVVSPFCSTAALDTLASSTRESVILVSRTEELARIDPAVRARFVHVQVLKEVAETEDGEDAFVAGGTLRGLHAKAYLAEKGKDTHLYVGSANATDAALVRGHNVELLAELVGRRSVVGGLDERMGPDGMGAVLEDFPLQSAPSPPEEVEADRALDAGRRALADAGLVVEMAPEGDGWRIVLRTEAPLRLDGIAGARAWLITQPEERSIDALALAHGEPVAFAPVALAMTTGFVAFELVAPPGDVRARFTLNLPLLGAPDERAAEILRSTIRDPAGFLRYILLLLQLERAGDAADAAGHAAGERWEYTASVGDFPLLEELTRALSRDPARLYAIRRLLRDVDAPGNEVVPAEFRDAWRVFDKVLPEEEP
jgi:hypothetical protein